MTNKGVKIHLSRILGEQRQTQTWLSRKTGIRKNTISDLYNEFASSVKLEHLEAICDALNCTLSDLMEYAPKPKSNEKS